MKNERKPRMKSMGVWRRRSALRAEHREPAEDFGGTGDGDGHGGEREGCSGVGIHAADEHVVTPDDEAEDADERRVATTMRR